MRLAKRVGQSITAIGCALMLAAVTLQPLAMADVDLSKSDGALVVKKDNTVQQISSDLVSTYVNIVIDNFTDIDELQSVAFSWLFFVCYYDSYTVCDSTSLSLPNCSATVNVVFNGGITYKYDGSIFNDDYLQVYFDIFTGKYDDKVLTKKTTDNCSKLHDDYLQQFIYDYYDCCNKTVPQLENYLGLFWKPTLISAWNIGKPLTCMSGVQQDFTKYYITFSRFKSLMNNFLSLYNGNRIDTKISIDTVPASDFAYMVEQENTSAVPKNQDLFMHSYRTDKYIHSNYSTKGITLWDSATIGDSFEDLYLYPFYLSEDNVYYYTDYQYHLYYVDNDDPNSDVALYIDVYKWVSDLGYILQSGCCGIIREYTTATLPYTIWVYPTPVSGMLNSYFCFGDYGDVEEYSSPTSSTFNYRVTNILPVNYLDSDGDVYDDLFNPAFCYDESEYKVADTGFFCCHELITREYSNIDTSKIPDNYYVTISGDTIYDYSITNPETGQSDTINNYVTNNYTYTTNNNYGSGDGGNGTGGSVDGSITVDGRVDVGGTVSVDVNVNVNGGAASGGGVDYGDINTDPLDDYLNSALDDSSGIRQFMGDFFGFMPAELVVLLGIGLTFVIIGRIMGR